MAVLLAVVCCAGGGEPLESAEIQSMVAREASADPDLVETRSGREWFPPFWEMMGWAGLMRLSLGAMIALPALLV
jgi:hypothetical protein